MQTRVKNGSGRRRSSPASAARRGRGIRLAWAVAVLAAGVAVAAHADSTDKDVIDYRQHVMNTLNEQSAALGEILSTVVPDDNVTAHLQVLALTASTALKAFEPKVTGGQAKPEVWSNWSDFSKRMTEFTQKVTEAAKKAQAGSKEEVMTNIADTLSCKSCHDVYREEKK
jgi:cytochrome c556